ncbi:hypothetical protein FQN57_006714 [Myotisia sp. PD_48]|nr:hypothetical protein FQN57_006714 [Myotisia sp. PD_48]
MQRQSPLFKLPPEIRVLIYKFALVHGPYKPRIAFGPVSFDNELIHILEYEEGLASSLVHRRCSSKNPDSHGSDCSRNCYGPGDVIPTPKSAASPMAFPPDNQIISVKRPANRKRRQDGPVFHDLLSLSLSCQRIYTESIPTLYSWNRFKINDIATFLLFRDRVPPLVLKDSIRTLSLDWPVCIGHRSLLTMLPRNLSFDSFTTSSIPSSSISSSHSSSPVGAVNQDQDEYEDEDVEDIFDVPILDVRWRMVCDTLKQMAGLRTLRIRIMSESIGDGVRSVASALAPPTRSHDGAPPMWTSWEDMVIEVLREIHLPGLETFEVQVNWPLSNGDKKPGDEFTLTEMPKEWMNNRMNMRWSYQYTL